MFNKDLKTLKANGEQIFDLKALERWLVLESGDTYLSPCSIYSKLCGPCTDLSLGMTHGLSVPQ